MRTRTFRSMLLAGITVTTAFALGADLSPAAAAPAPAPAAAPSRSAQPLPARFGFGYPLVIGHRGAPGYRPEHTLAGYTLAVQLGADYIEPDLVSTKDGVLVDRHEPEISGTTDVARHPEFAARKVTKRLDGVPTTGWFAEDFTLAELKTLHAVERLPAIRQHNTLYDGLFQVPTLQEDIDLVKRLERKYHRTIGLIPEIKHSTYFRAAGLPMERRLLRVLKRNGLDGRRAPTIIQSFEVGNLKYLHTLTTTRLVQLTSATGAPYDFTASGNPRTYADITTARGLRQVATYAELLGPDKNQIVPRDANNRLLPPTALVRNAHRAGLLVTPYTFRDENAFLPADYQRGTNPADYGNALAEYRLFFALGVDGVFSDNADTAVLARQQWLAEGGRRAA
ncbi:MAG: glycerophosphodiester phosphodiesterase [Actinomycetota bacterium]|nr:glycerophosphodiester phosphodiesterase [Actinomycetota bacterium]